MINCLIGFNVLLTYRDFLIPYEILFKDYSITVLDTKYSIAKNEKKVYIYIYEYKAQGWYTIQSELILYTVYQITSRPVARGDL